MVENERFFQSFEKSVDMPQAQSTQINPENLVKSEKSEQPKVE